MNRKGYRAYTGRRQKHTLRNVIITLLLIAILCFSALFGLVLYGNRDQISGEPQVMIVLGCQVKPWGPSILLQDRLDKALAYLEENPGMTVIVSGGQGPDEHISEAQAMYEYLVGNGVSDKQILREDQSHNTFQNLTRTVQLIVEKGYTADDVVVVSNGFHLTRVRMLWDRVYDGEGSLSVLAAPSSHLPSRLKMYIREPLALAKSFLLDRN